ncbi:MAG: CDP-diacylglycerol--glycerol-3-phosphate 3-phosphatidyltransferase [Candidatus Sericytochromatia bacterium]
MTIPNLLTIFRIVLIPFFCFFIFDLKTYGVYKSAHPDSLLIAGIIFSVAAITDFFDGYLARKWNQTSNLGKLLDPLADKLLITAALIGLVEWQFIAGWTVVVILSREFIITALRGMLADIGVKPMGASRLGKIKTILQITAVIAFLFDLRWVGGYIYDLALIFTIISGVDYMWKSKQYLKF